MPSTKNSDCAVAHRGEIEGGVAGQNRHAVPARDRTRHRRRPSIRLRDRARADQADRQHERACGGPHQTTNHPVLPSNRTVGRHVWQIMTLVTCHGQRQRPGRQPCRRSSPRASRSLGAVVAKHSPGRRLAVIRPLYVPPNATCGGDGVMGKLHEDDDVCNLSSNETFQEVLDRRLSRRSVLGGGLAVAATATAVGAAGGGVATLVDSATGRRRERRPAAASPRVHRHRHLDRGRGRGAARLHGQGAHRLG